MYFRAVLYSFNLIKLNIFFKTYVIEPFLCSINIMSELKAPHEEYLLTEIDLFKKNQSQRSDSIISETTGIEIKSVIDVGCGAGQELLPFAQMEDVKCVGVDVSDAAGPVFREFFDEQSLPSTPIYVQSKGEELPFDAEQFDVVICRVALPYMNNRRALTEMARVLRPGGLLLLRTHSPKFYLGMVKRRLKEMDPKLLAYPILCFMGGIWHWLAGRRSSIPLLRDKEVFQTVGTIERDIKQTGLVIKKDRKTRCGEARAMVLQKVSLCNLIVQYFLGSDTLYLGLSAIH